VAAFLEGKLGWGAIPDVIEAVLAVHHGGPPQSADDVIEADRLARATARREVARRTERRVQQP
jgi:1-deoxy-D-xylulose 5-phosphate reductoisomerase